MPGSLLIASGGVYVGGRMVGPHGPPMIAGGVYSGGVMTVGVGRKMFGFGLTTPIGGVTTGAGRGGVATGGAFGAVRP